MASGILSAALALSVGVAFPATASASTEPNYFQLHGAGLRVVYSTANPDGKPTLTYRDRSRTMRFGPGEIRTERTGIGTLVTVTVAVTVDSGFTTFTLVVPQVDLDSHAQVPVDTFGVTTAHRLGVPPSRPAPGQDELYRLTRLSGKATLAAHPGTGGP